MNLREAAIEEVAKNIAADYCNEYGQVWSADKGFDNYRAIARALFDRVGALFPHRLNERRVDGDEAEWNGYMRATEDLADAILAQLGGG